MSKEMTIEEAKKNLKVQIECMKKANECGLATKGEFKEDIEAIEVVLQELEELEKENIHWRGKYYLLNREILQDSSIKQSKELLAEEALQENVKLKKQLENSISVDVIKEKIEELNKEYIDILNEYGNTDTDVIINIPNKNVREHLDELVFKITILEEILQERGK